MFRRGGAGGSFVESALMPFRFTIRDLLWLTLVVALATGWWLDHKGRWSDIPRLRIGMTEQEAMRVLIPEPFLWSGGMHSSHSVYTHRDIPGVRIEADFELRGREYVLVGYSRDN